MSDILDQIREEEALNLSMERVKKINSPLLVIGLGGTGCDAVRKVKKEFARRFDLPKDKDGYTIPVPEQTAYLAFDSDSNNKKGFDAGEFWDMTVPKLGDIIKGGKLTEEEKSWINASAKFAGMVDGHGAGTYRQASRLMLSRKYDMVKTAISGALTGIVATGEVLGRLEVVLVTGIGGGTGSGMFLDMAQIVRHIIAHESALNMGINSLTGYIVMPDVSIENVKKDAPAMVSIIKSNGFAALKELDFWMNVEEHGTPYAVRYAAAPTELIRWDKPPFDHCILMSSIAADGVVFENGYEMVMGTIAENLLHYLADETPIGAAKKYSYLEFESNLANMVNTHVKSAKKEPVNVAYRAVGAYAMLTPKKKMFKHEGAMLYGTFMPPRNDHGDIVPNHALLNDGKTAERAQAITGSLGDLYNEFAMNCPCPDAYDCPSHKATFKVKTLQGMTPAPHDAYRIEPFNWTNTVAIYVKKSAEAYLESAWAAFSDFMNACIGDPSFGPFSAREYLSDANGLLTALRSTQNEWENWVLQTAGDVGAWHEACRNSHFSFQKPPLIMGGKAVDTYLHNLGGLLNAERIALFADAYHQALKTLIQRIDAYRKNALVPLCSTLDALDREFAIAGKAAVMSEDLFDIAAIAPHIAHMFEVKNAAHAVTCAYLKRLSGASLATVPDVNEFGCGVKFPFGDHARREVLETMRSELDNCLGGINNQSFDALIAQMGHITLKDKKDYLGTIASNLLAKSQPMFAQNPLFMVDPKAEYSYFSVPIDPKLGANDPSSAVQILNSIAKTTNFTPKASNLKDHLYVTTAWDGLALSRYSMMSDMEVAYNNTLSNPDTGMAIHLVWHGDPNENYARNWSKLPSPSPFYMSGTVGAVRDIAQYASAKALVGRAHASGMLEADDTLENPTFTFRFFCNDFDGTIPTAPEVTLAQLAAAVAAVDPVTKAKLAPEACMANIAGLRNSAAVKVIAPGVKPFFMAGYLGMNSGAIPKDPFSPAIAANPALLAQAKANYRKLVEEEAVCVVLQNPMMYERMAYQIDAFEAIEKEMQKIGTLINVWEPRIAYGSVFAGLYEYGLLAVRPVIGLVYRDTAGADQSLIQPGLLAGDLEGQSMMLKSAAYLSDITAAHPVRQYLEHEQGVRSAAFNAAALAGSLTPTEIGEHIARLNELEGHVRRELNEKQAQKMKLGADVDRIGKQSALLQGVLNAIAALKEPLTIR